MRLITDTFANQLTDDEARDAFTSAQLRTFITQQIRAIRNQRGWSQEEFGELLGKPQSAISRLEDRDYGRYTLQTLLEIATTYKLGLVVEFVEYQNFLWRTHDMSAGALQRTEFSREALDPLCSDGPAMRVVPKPIAGTVTEASEAARGPEITKADATIDQPPINRGAAKRAKAARGLEYALS